MKKNRFVAGLLSAAMMVSVLAGCGGSTAASSSESSSQAPASSSEAASSAASGESEAAGEATTEGAVKKPDNFPKKEITLIIPFAAGGAFDVMARTLQPIIKENDDINLIVTCVEGGGSAVGVTQTLTSKPDGYTIGFGSTSYLGLIAQGRMQMNPTNADFLCSISSDPMVLVAKADGPYQTAEDYINAAKENPGTITLGNPGTNNTNQASAKFLDMAVGDGTFQLTPFSDGDARVVTEILGGHLAAGVLKPNSCMSQLKSGELKILATFTKERLESFPDVPTFEELGYDVFPYGDVAQTVCFALAPKGLDPEIKAYLADVLYRATQSEEFQALAAEGGFEAPGIHGEELDEYVGTLYESAEILAEKVFSAA